MELTYDETMDKLDKKKFFTSQRTVYTLPPGT